MKTLRVKDFDPDAKVPTLKSSLDNMPAIQKPKHANITPLSRKMLSSTEAVEKTEKPKKANEAPIPPRTTRTGCTERAGRTPRTI